MSLPQQQAIEREVSETFVRRLGENWLASDEAEHEMRLARDPTYRTAWQRISGSWESLGRYAETPALLAYRTEAVTFARRARARRALARAWRAPRWRVAAAAGVLAFALAVGWLISPHAFPPDQYQTGIGERRTIELDDRSRVVLDAQTRVRVRYSHTSRTVELVSGQAEFAVAKDPARPFQVQAGDRSVVAVGTVFTVEYTDRTVHVAMVEGTVDVLPVSGNATQAFDQARRLTRIEAVSGQSGGAPRHEGAGIELVAGEELRVGPDGNAVVTLHGDLQAATAWRDGKVIFRSEPLGSAASRMNRYSHLQLHVDGTQLAAKRISGVFDAGDTRGFVTALQHYLPDLTVDSADPNTLILRSR